MNSALLLLLALLTGCTALAPYERATLMTRVMQDPYDLQEATALTGAVQLSEGMAGATVASGASCGCR